MLEDIVTFDFLAKVTAFDTKASVLRDTIRRQFFARGRTDPFSELWKYAADGQQKRIRHSENQAWWIPVGLVTGAIWKDKIRIAFPRRGGIWETRDPKHMETEQRKPQNTGFLQIRGENHVKRTTTKGDTAGQEVNWNDIFGYA